MLKNLETFRPVTTFQIIFSCVENLKKPRRQCKQHFEVINMHSNGIFECYNNVWNVIYVLSSETKVFT